MDIGIVLVGIFSVRLFLVCLWCILSVSYGCVVW